MSGDVEYIRHMLTEQVAKPLGGSNQSGPYPDSVRYAAGNAETSGQLITRIQERFARAQELVGRIVAASEAALDLLAPTDSEQANARHIAGTVLKGTQNPHAKSALRSMDTLGRDTPPLIGDARELTDRSQDLAGVLDEMGDRIKQAISTSTANVPETFGPLLGAAHETAHLAMNYGRQF